jgi:hypothetical protein
LGIPLGGRLNSKVERFKKMEGDMSYQTYKVLHFIGIFFVLISLGGMTLHVINGGTRSYANRKWVAMIHGIGITLALVGGFGLLARLGVTGGLPAWIYGKLGVWLILAALPALIYRAPNLAKILFVITPLIAAFAGYLAITKPGGIPSAASPNPANQTTPVPTPATPSAQ